MNVKCRGFEGELESIYPDKVKTVIRCKSEYKYTLKIMVNDTDYVELHGVSDEEIEFSGKNESENAANPEKPEKTDKSEEKVAQEQFLKQIKGLRREIDDGVLYLLYACEWYCEDTADELMRNMIELMHAAGFTSVKIDKMQAKRSYEVKYRLTGNIPEGFEL